MKTPRPPILRIIAFALLAAILPFLLGCGGGGDEEDRQGTHPVNCQLDGRCV